MSNGSGRGFVGGDTLVLLLHLQFLVGLALAIVSGLAVGKVLAVGRGAT